MVQVRLKSGQPAVGDQAGSTRLEEWQPAGCVPRVSMRSREGQGDKMLIARWQSAGLGRRSLEGCLKNIGVPNLSRTSSELNSSEMKELAL